MYTEYTKITRKKWPKYSRAQTYAVMKANFIIPTLVLSPKTMPSCLYIIYYIILLKAD